MVRGFVWFMVFSGGIVGRFMGTVRFWEFLFSMEG